MEGDLFKVLKDNLLNYLNKEKEYIEEDIQQNSLLPDDIRVQKGYTIPNACKNRKCENLQYIFTFEENNSKFRPGDKVLLVGKESKQQVESIVIENGYTELFLESSKELKDSVYDIHVIECMLLKPLINLLEQLQDGMPGSYFLKLLAGLEKPESKGIGALDEGLIRSVINSGDLDDYQRLVIENALRRPSLYCIQGPPGTGKTKVLSTIATAYSNAGYDVLILSGTHQAVNNALNKISIQNKRSRITKIGAVLKAEGLVDRVNKLTYNEFLGSRKKTKKKMPDIVGMTFHAAIINMGLMHRGFLPSIILIDEAGQIPLAYASVFGMFGSGSIIFIGDDKQMPPIYHEKLQNNEYSCSIFEHIRKLYPEIISMLSVSYRMNNEITEVVDRLFYSTNGEQHLFASSFSAFKKLSLNTICEDLIIRNALNTSESFVRINTNTNSDCADVNFEEAKAIAMLVNEALSSGLSRNEIAVITPYRRQVRAIRNSLMEVYMMDIPIIDTVERLQGQDVEMVIISFCSTNYSFICKNSDFLFSPNRLNVMISRAKSKVIIYASDAIVNANRNLKLGYTFL